MTYKILCCDGGGIRGLITALLIQNLEETCEGFIDTADSFAGTSTGGLISLGLAMGQPIDKIVSIYKTKGKEIFTPNGWFEAEAALGAPPPDQDEEPEVALLAAGPGNVRCQYKADGLKKLAEELLGTHELQNAEKMVAVTSAQLWDKTIKSWRARTLSSLPGNEFKEVRMVDAALATAAAPTYFPPHRIADHFGYFADGGVFANNPVMSAIGEVLGNGLVDDIGDIRVLSLGTGEDPQGIPPAVFTKYPPLSWGASKWLWPYPWEGTIPGMALISLMFAATSTTNTVQAGQLFGDRFRRANVPLANPYDLDDYKNIKQLEKATLDYMTGKEWEEVREWVAANWT